jgi:hypothetical protein
MSFIPAATAASVVRWSSGVVPVGEALAASPVEAAVEVPLLPLHPTRATMAAATTSPDTILEFRITLLESVGR